jgi:hypothetical protein
MDCYANSLFESIHSGLNCILHFRSDKLERSRVSWVDRVVLVFLFIVFAIIFLLLF